MQLMEVVCRCGWSTRGSRSEVIANIQAHGRAAHDLEVTAREIRALWRVVGETSERKRAKGRDQV